MAVFTSLKIVDLGYNPATNDYWTIGESADEWLLDFVAAIFGAYDPETGQQMIREGFLLVSKKNTKSTIAAGIMLTELICGWRPSDENLILAPTIEVAGNSFKPAMDMIRADDELDALLHPQEHIRTITNRNNKSTLKVVAADSATVSGKKASRVLIDELWLFGKKATADAMFREATGGQVARPEGYTLYLTTQSDEPPAGVFKDKLAYARDVRDGLVEDKEFLPVLYEYPEEMIEAKEHPGNPGNYVRSKSWPAQLKDLLIAAGIPARHDAYFSSQPDTTIANVSGANPNIAPGAGWVLSSYSLSGTILQCPNTVTTATAFTPEIAADSFDIIHSANAGLGTMLLTDEDGLNVSINTGSTAGAQVISSGGLGLKRTTITRPVASTKPIQISRSAGGALYIEAIIPYNSASPCLELLNMGWPGSRAYGTSGNGHWNLWADPSTMTAATPYAALGALNSDGYIIELGTNDAAGGIAASDFQTAINNIASKLKGQAGGNGANVALVKCRVTIGSYASYNMSSDMLAALDTVTASLGLAPVINFNTIPFVTADRFDGTHLSAQGYGKEATVARLALIGV